MPADIDPLGWNSDEEDERFPSWSGWTGSVLLNDEIEYYCRPDAKHRLIDPFDTDLLKPARYQLRMGDEARVGNRVIKVAPGQPLKLEPHQVAIVKTYEKLNIPRFLIARWNLTVDMVYQGLLWVGALQVDPGWVGYLPCPLYNMSDQPVEIYFQQKLFTIDFVRTTPFSNSPTAPDRCKRYRRENARVNPPLSSFDTVGLKSGPYEKLKLLDELVEFRGSISALLGVLFAALGAVVAAVGVVVTRPAGEVIWKGVTELSFWPTTALAWSAIALVISTYAMVLTLQRTNH